MGIEPVGGVSTAPANGWNAKVGPEIDTAVKDITKLMNSDGAFTWVNDDDVKKAANILAKLDANSADTVIDRLDKAGKLDDFAREVVDDSMVGGGISASERGQLFANMAKQLDGKSLAAVEKAFAETSNGVDGTKLADEFSKAVATHASPQAKVDFVKSLAANSTNETERYTNNTFFGGSSLTTQSGDPEALAIANVIGSMTSNPATASNAYAKQALDALNPKQFDAVVAAAAGRTDTGMTVASGGAVGYSNSTRYDPAALVKLGNVVAASGTVEQKAAFVDAAGEQLKGITDQGSLLSPGPAASNKDAEKAVRDSITKVLGNPNANGNQAGAIIEQLANNKNSWDGEGFSAYAKSMLSTGKAGEEALGEYLETITHGDDGKGNPVDRLAARVDPKTNQVISNRTAVAAGFFAGSVWSAVDSTRKDNAAKAESWMKIVEAASQAHPAAAAGVVLIKDDILKAMGENKENLGETIYNSMIPSDAKGNPLPGAGGQVTIDFPNILVGFDRAKTFE